MANESPLLTIAELAKLLDVSQTQVHRMRKGGLIPEPVKINRQVVRWRRQDIDSWINQGCPKREKAKSHERTV